MSAIVRIRAEIIIKGVEIQPIGRKKWGTYCIGFENWGLLLRISSNLLAG